jgi:hypothetical protein
MATTLGTSQGFKQPLIVIQNRSNSWTSTSSFAKNLPRGWIFSPKGAGIKKEPPV